MCAFSVCMCVCVCVCVCVWVCVEHVGVNVWSVCVCMCVCVCRGGGVVYALMYVCVFVLLCVRQMTFRKYSGASHNGPSPQRTAPL